MHIKHIILGSAMALAACVSLNSVAQASPLADWPLPDGPANSIVPSFGEDIGPVHSQLAHYPVDWSKSYPEGGLIITAEAPSPKIGPQLASADVPWPRKLIVPGEGAGKI